MQDLPHVAGMVPHPGQTLDGGGHTGQGPQIGAKPLGPRPLAKQALDPLELLAVQFGFATGSAGSSEGGQAALPPGSVPATDTLAAHVERPSDKGQNLAGAEQLSGPLAPLF